ncbi:MAG: amidohydrolase [Hyphomicrobiales bacterium]|nr:amidohydrolase [Hyphomicrobiales bacterium]
MTPAAQRMNQGGTRVDTMEQGGRTPRVIDFHAHVLHPDVYALTVNHNVISGFGARPMEERPDPAGPRWAMFSKMVLPEVQIADMDRRGIDLGVISTSTVSQSVFWAQGPLAAELDRAANDRIADWVARYPDRFAGAFTLPLQDMDLALAELARCDETLRLSVVNLPACVDGRYLGDARFAPLWREIEARRLTAFVHPDGVKDPAFQEFSLWNGVGQGIEETRAMASIIYEGVLERFPDLRIVFAHGGGYLPAYVGRLDRNAAAHPVSMRNISRLPSECLKRFYYDTVVYDPLVLEIIGRRVGFDRLVFGTDYPFGEEQPLASLAALGFDEPTRHTILCDNAERALRRA